MCFPEHLQLQRKMEERRLRLQEEANRSVWAKFISWVSYQCMHLADDFMSCFFASRRFATCNTVTPEEQEQRVLYARVLEYEQDHVSLSWLRHLVFVFVALFCSDMLMTSYVIVLSFRNGPKFGKLD